MEVINCNNISVTFKSLFSKFKALDNVSFKVNEGDIYGFLGPNGAGKTTTMNCLLGMLRPVTGTVEVFGERLTPGCSSFKNISYLPEVPIYPEYLTVIESLRYFSYLYDKNISDKKIDEYLKRFQMTKYKKFLLKNCSKGMKQKVGVIQSLISKPRLLFLDEPTRGLDPVTVKVMREAILDLNKYGTTVFLNSHVIAEVEKICNRIAVINKGQIVREENITDFKKGDHTGYSVKFETKKKLPDYITITSTVSSLINGEIPEEDLGKFMKFVTQGKAKLHNCSLKDRSLEDALFDLLEKENENV
ncbi:ABC transporter ATP-binding protein [bacterium]|nr:ABC transporter ATP-binding protein [bacterium]